MSASKLIRPTIDYKDSFLEALREFQAEGLMSHLDHETLRSDEAFKAFIEELRKDHAHSHKPYPDWVEPVPETVVWLTKDEDYIGTAEIRHRLNWHLEKWGGNMSFMLRPSWRGKGFGRKIFRKALTCAASFGLERVLLTVNPENQAAQSVIEDAGGELEDITTETDRFPSRCRYWVELD